MDEQMWQSVRGEETVSVSLRQSFNLSTDLRALIMAAAAFAAPSDR